MKKIIFVFIAIMLITGCSLIDKKNNGNKNNESEIIMESIKVIIDDISYDIKLENNDTVLAFIKLLPKELTMSELNGNEKYVYMDESLPTNSFNPQHINSGDVMLYGNNCLVIFYKSFDTNYSYTKIGHINNLENLGNGSIKVKFEREQ